MPINPKDLWTTLPTALQRQIVNEVAAVLAEASHEVRAGQTDALGAKGGRELALTLPIGLVRDPSGVVVKDPNLEVQERLELLFQTFLKVRTIAKVMRGSTAVASTYRAAIVTAICIGLGRQHPPSHRY